MCVQRIRDVYPELVIETVRFNGDGQFNDILVINEELIFRFPRYAHGVERLAVETAILSAIQDYVSLPIPDPVYRSRGAQVVGEVFVGYRMIPGEPLWRDTLLAINDDATLQRLATQLARFLHELHTVPAEALALDLPISDSPDNWMDMYTRFYEKLFPYMRPDARDWVVHHFETFLADTRSFNYKPVLRHGDFGPGNILFDPTTRVITGIIDFGSAGLGDPAVDLAGILCPAGYGEAFLSRFYRVYPEIELMLARARFYAGTFALQEALYGIEHGDQEAFERGIAQYV